jgi:hypothetical protein
MARTCCFARIDASVLPRLTEALALAGETSPPVEAELDVRVLGTLRPDLLIADVDHLATDPLEMLRQLRFVLPACVIAVARGPSCGGERGTFRARDRSRPRHGHQGRHDPRMLYRSAVRRVSLPGIHDTGAPGVAVRSGLLLSEGSRCSPLPR